MAPAEQCFILTWKKKSTPWGPFFSMLRFKVHMLGKSFCCFCLSMLFCQGVYIMCVSAAPQRFIAEGSPSGSRLKLNSENKRAVVGWPPSSVTMFVLFCFDGLCKYKFDVQCLSNPWTFSYGYVYKKSLFSLSMKSWNMEGSCHV